MKSLIENFIFCVVAFFVTSFLYEPQKLLKSVEMQFYPTNSFQAKLNWKGYFFFQNAFILKNH